MDNGPTFNACGGHLCGFLTFIQVAHGHAVEYLCSAWVDLGIGQCLSEKSADHYTRG